MQKVRQAYVQFTIFLSLMFTASFASAQATLPAEVTAMFADTGAMIALIFAAAIGVWTVLRGFYVIFKVGGKMLSKAGG